MVTQPKADTQPIMATATAVKYPKTKSRFNIAPLLSAEATGMTWVRLFMATLLQIRGLGVYRCKLLQQLGDASDVFDYARHVPRRTPAHPVNSCASSLDFLSDISIL